MLIYFTSIQYVEEIVYGTENVKCLTLQN